MLQRRARVSQLLSQSFGGLVLGASMTRSKEAAAR